MKSSEIRQSFLDFFRERNHAVVGSSSLIPSHDPTLLFTNAGMVQFKSVFLGEEKRDYCRAATSQKCMRAGGKHSDIENVGHTARHHTFFEMLGNFSFGDYFKHEAIAFAWELLTGRYCLPKDRLWVSVFQDDDEAALLWQQVAGVPESRIVRLGAKDNFWQMGDTGPCGPCSEIILDQGAGIGCGRPECAVGCDCDRYLELWNLVFMQFNRDESGTLTPLPRPSIDTGMGLERISAVLQGKTNNFDTDLFTPVIRAIGTCTGVAYGKNPAHDASIRVIADHARASAFLIADGLTPSNEGRGYVLRRIIRRASRYARLLGADHAVLYRLIEPVAETMGDIYPELKREASRAAKLLRIEEERFMRTLEQGTHVLDNVIAKLTRDGGRTIPGEALFLLYDTYGFPVDLARDIARDHGLGIDEDAFRREMDRQRERARSSWVGEEEAIASIYRELSSEFGDTVFNGYSETGSESVILAIVQNGVRINRISAGEEAGIILDRTPFYGESGGQAGDTGAMVSDGASAMVTDTKKEVGLHIHKVRVEQGSLAPGDRLRCSVDSEIRLDTARNHTATHLLHASLRVILGEHVKQAGSLVSPERLRFDFTHFLAVDRKDLDSIEDMVNEKIRENISIETEIGGLEEALAAGVTALFGEKYGDRVRIVRAPGFSAELCGGTHCSSTGEIGFFTIVSEGSVASGIRRIEAFTGRGANGFVREKRDELRKIADVLKTDRPAERIEGVITEMKERDREITVLKAKMSARDSGDVISSVRDIGGVKTLSIRVSGMDPKDLRTFADSVRDRMGSGVLVIASLHDGSAAVIAMVTKDLTKRFHAGDILKRVLEICGGRGGGKAEMAQGGISRTDTTDVLDGALERVYEIVAGR